MKRLVYLGAPERITRNGRPVKRSTAAIVPHIEAMQHLDLSDDEAAALELHDIVENDRYPFSPRIRTLRAILAKLRPEPVRQPLPPPKVYAPPRATAARRKRRGR